MLTRVQRIVSLDPTVYSFKCLGNVKDQPEGECGRQVFYHRIALSIACILYKEKLLIRWNIPLDK